MDTIEQTATPQPETTTAAGAVDDSSFTAALEAMGSTEGTAPTEEPPVSVEPPAAVEGNEAAPEAAPQPSKSEVYAKMAQMDRENRLLKKQLKERESAAPAVDYSALAKQDPLGAMEKLGLNLDKILEAYSGVESSAAEDSKDAALPSHIQEQLNKYAELEKQVQELAAAKQHESISKQLHTEAQRIDQVIRNVEKETPGKYEFINATKDEGSLNLVIQVAAALYEQEGEVPTYTDVLDRVENHLRETELARLDRLQKLSFVRSRLTGAQPSVQLKGNGAANTPLQASKTLSPQEDTPTPKEMSEEDYFELALKALKASNSR